MRPLMMTSLVAHSSGNAFKRAITVSTQARTYSDASLTGTGNMCSLS